MRVVGVVAAAIVSPKIDEIFFHSLSFLGSGALIFFFGI